MRTSTTSTLSRTSKLSLDLSNLPPLTQPVTPTNTLIFTNLLDRDIFRPDNLETIRDLVSKTAPIHSWAPLRSFARIVVSFFSEDDAITVRRVWDSESIMGADCHVYFGRPTPLAAKEEHLALPDAGKLFFISPPPSPPHDWEMRLEDAPNKLVHAEDLAEALAKLHHNKASEAVTGLQTPISPTGGNTRSRSSTLIFQPGQDGASPELPAIAICDMTDEPEDFISPIDVNKPIMAHTSRPPVELMHHA